MSEKRGNSPIQKAAIASTEPLLTPSEVLTVTSSNALVRSYYSDITSVIFLRLFNLVASQIQRSDSDFHAYTVPFIALIGDHTTGGQYYKMINNISDEAMKVIIKIPESDERLVKYSLFSKCVIDKGKNVLEVSIHPDLKPHLLKLKNHFTRIQLKEFFNLPSIYSQRLFQLLSSWRSSPYWRVGIETLHDMIGSSPSMRKDFKEFRVHALERSQNDILSHTSLYFRYEIERQGRKAKFIIFYFEPEEDAVKQEKAEQEINDLQKKSNKCFESHMKKEGTCTPKKKSKKCMYCLNRGRKSVDQFRLWDEPEK